MKQINNVIVGQRYDVKRFGSSALNTTGRRWVVVRTSTAHFGRVYVNQVGGDGHRVTPRGYRKIESAYGQFAVGTEFVVENTSPVSGSNDCIRIQIVAPSNGSLGGCPDTASSKGGCGCSETAHVAAAPKPSVPGKIVGTVYLNGKALKIVE